MGDLYAAQIVCLGLLSSHSDGAVDIMNGCEVTVKHEGTRKKDKKNCVICVICGSIFSK